MPTGGGTIEHVSVLAGGQSVKVPVVVRGNEIWPRKTLPAGQRLSIQVVVRRPGWMSWLTGSTQRVTLSMVTPSSSIRSRFLTVHRGQSLQVAFDRPGAGCRVRPGWSAAPQGAVDPRDPSVAAA